MPSLDFSYTIEHAQPSISSLVVTENSTTNCILSVDTDGLGGTLYVFPSSTATPLDAATIQTNGTAVNVTEQGTYFLDSDVSVVPGSTRYYNVVHYNFDTQSNVLVIEVVAPSVPDNEAPLITLNGDAVIDLVVGGAFEDPGAIVSDNVDADRTVDATTGSVNTNVAGTYYLFYDAQDNSGNTADQVVRVVNVNTLEMSIPFDFAIEHMGFDIVSFDDVQRGSTGMLVLRYTREIPSVDNVAIDGLTITEVNDNGDDTFTVEFSVPADLAKKNGEADFDITLGSFTHNHQSTVLTQAGWESIDVDNPTLADGSVFFRHTGDTPENDGQIEFTLISIQDGLEFSFATNGAAQISRIETGNTEEIILTEDVHVIARYISPAGEVGRTATISYGMGDLVVIDPVIPPTITPNTPTTISIQVGDDFTLPLWTAADDLTAVDVIFLGDDIDTSNAGTYFFQATASNAVGEALPITLTVLVEALVPIVAQGTLVDAKGNPVPNMTGLTCLFFATMEDLQKNRNVLREFDGVSVTNGKFTVTTTSLSPGTYFMRLFDARDYDHFAFGKIEAA